MTSAACRDETEGKFPRPGRVEKNVEVEMADEQKKKCARETCGCPASEGSKYCSEECEDAAKVHMMEIGCTCHHPDCG